MRMRKIQNENENDEFCSDKESIYHLSFIIYHNNETPFCAGIKQSLILNS